MTTLAARLDALAKVHGERPALISRDETVSFAGLAAGARRIAAALAALGAGKGTRVGLLMPNRPDWLRCAWGVWRLGAVLVPLNTLYRGPELAHALHHADVTILIGVASFLGHDYAALLAGCCPEIERETATIRSPSLPCLRHVVLDGARLSPAAIAWSDFLRLGDGGGAWADACADAVVPGDDAAIFFTSGSTATPKGVVHTHASMLQAADNVGDRLGLTAEDRTWGYLPFFFNGGLVGVALATLSRGGAVLLQEVFRADETLALLEQHRATTLFAWPHQAEALIALPQFDAQRLELRKGPGANTKWAVKLFRSDHQAVGTWGMTETGPMAACSRYDDPAARRSGSHGRAMPGLAIRIADPETGALLPPESEGEILVRGGSVMRTYYKTPPAQCFDAEGFFHTGDCGRLDAQGNLHFLGRLKDVIKTAGANVAAAEVEAVLLAHPGVKVTHVVPVPHPSRGENVGAFVVPSGTGCSEPELLAHCRDALASYKVPRHFFFCREEELPVLGSGKVDRQALRRRAAELAGSGQ
jgi:fatty-acyl-CoA synthase